MTKHKIVVSIELTDSGAQDRTQTLLAIAEGIVRNATEDYGIQGYEDGVPQADGGYDGPFVTLAIAKVQGLKHEEESDG
jgi:hypothetical protein